jgi:hypothetical protein
MEMTNAVMAKKHRSGKPPEHRDVQLRAERWDALAPDQRSRLPNNHTLEVVRVTSTVTAMSKRVASSSKLA